MLSNRIFHPPAFLFLLSIGLVLLTCLHESSITHSQGNKQAVQSWKSKLYEQDVKYENFACNKENAEIVSTFFKEHPLKSSLPVCHNDCPIIKCRPVIPFPPIGKAARIAGTVSVHVLVDERGKVLYARVLSGHPLLWATAQKGACETQFREYPFGKHQGVMHFTVDNYDYLDVPNGANEVW